MAYLFISPFGDKPGSVFVKALERVISIDWLFAKFKCEAKMGITHLKKFNTEILSLRREHRDLFRKFEVGSWIKLSLTSKIDINMVFKLFDLCVKKIIAKLNL